MSLNEFLRLFRRVGRLGLVTNGRRGRVGEGVGARRGGELLLRVGSQASYCSWLTTRMAIGMKAWSLPQSFEHWP